MIKHKLLGIIFPVFLLFSIFVQIYIPKKVQAAPTQNSIETIVRAYNAGLSLESCGIDAGYLKDRSRTDIKNGEVFLAEIGDRVKQVGYLTDSRDGKMSCQAGGEVVDVIEAAGFSDITKFFVDAGVYSFNKDGNVYTIVPGKSDADLGKEITGIISRKYNGEVVFSKPLPDYAQYRSLHASFQKACKPRALDGGTKIKLIKNGVVEEGEYAYEENIVSVGYGITGDSGGNGEMACDTIVERLNATAAAYKTQVEENKADSNPNNDGASDPNAPETTAEAVSCETQNTGIMDWVLCGIINVIDNVIVGTDGKGGMLGAINKILYIGPDLYNNDGLKLAWSYFRNIATLTLVLIGLVMIIGQAISKE